MPRNGATQRYVDPARGGAWHRRTGDYGVTRAGLAVDHAALARPCVLDLRKCSTASSALLRGRKST
jgi:hypothetical protein